MRGKKSISYTFVGIMMIMLLIISGCGSSEPSLDEYVGAVVEKTFPVPAEATHSESMLTNSEMRYIQYTMSGIHNDTIPEQYQQAISDWGWIEKEGVKPGNTMIYEKDNQMIQVSVQDNGFTILVPKQDRNLVIKGIESNEDSNSSEESSFSKESNSSDSSNP